MLSTKMVPENHHLMNLDKDMGMAQEQTHYIGKPIVSNATFHLGHPAMFFDFIFSQDAPS